MSCDDDECTYCAAMDTPLGIAHRDMLQAYVRTYMTNAFGMDGPDDSTLNMVPGKLKVGEHVIDTTAVVIDSSGNSGLGRFCVALMFSPGMEFTDVFGHKASISQDEVAAIARSYALRNGEAQGSA